MYIIFSSISPPPLAHLRSVPDVGVGNLATLLYSFNFNRTISLLFRRLLPKFLHFAGARSREIAQRFEVAYNFDFVT